MIFATVGTQDPFPRLIDALDRWAWARARRDIFAQVGPVEKPPSHIEWSEYVEPEQFRKHMTEADLIVAHAGMGTIITALCLSKPIIIMPRRDDLHETRNAHQLATAVRFGEIAGVRIATSEGQLFEHLDHAASIPAPCAIAPVASDGLLRGIREFILDQQKPTPLPRARAVGDVP